MRNSDRLMSLINDLLDLSSIEASDKINKTAIDTKELTGRVMEKLHRTIQEKQHEISTVFDVPIVLGDLLRVEQVLTNLLDNACKYTPTGGKIAVSWEYEQMGRIVALRVSDNGPGIPTEHHDRLFERFYRVDKGRSREMGGTGLGLSIVKHIMQQHGGTVRVQSASRVGTTFICTFPDN
jgi:two-component system phosphate regulon sensor histidine kinase PhoR